MVVPATLLPARSSTLPKALPVALVRIWYLYVLDVPPYQAIFTRVTVAAEPRSTVQRCGSAPQPATHRVAMEPSSARRAGDPPSTLLAVALPRRLSTATAGVVGVGVGEGVLVGVGVGEGVTVWAGVGGGVGVEPPSVAGTSLNVPPKVVVRPHPP